MKNLPTLATMVLSSLLLLSAGACQHAGPSMKAEPPRRALRLPDDVSRDPTARLMFMERLRVQVLQKTTGLPRAEHAAVRARLRHQLTAAGLDRQEADYILSNLDPSAQAIEHASTR